MTRRRRRQDVRGLFQRYHDLPPEERGRVSAVLLGNALVSVALQLALLGIYVRLVRRISRRRHGVRTTTGDIGSRLVVLSTCAYGCYAVLSRLLLLRWVRRLVERAERATTAAEKTPSP